MSAAAGIGFRGRSELTAVLEASGRRFVRPGDVAATLGVDSQTAAKKLARWATEGWLRRARRGLYIPVPVDASNPASWSEDALVVATAVWSPCYFTGWTAANYWSLTEQLFRTTVLKTTERVRASTVVLLDHEYLVRHTSPAAMTWGLRTEWQREIRLKFADPARTVVDLLDEPRLGGGIRHGAEVLATYLDEHDPALLIEYGDRLGNRAIFKRLGYLLETLERNEPSLVAACRARLSEGISALDPDGPTGGRRTMRWRLRVNAQVRPQAPA
ncbi:MAG TPA: type IV toxin-antitoxin system AbiEi family antitoxin domain-containing protein [Candidatus Micrarchaeaceae archaeon]|nr:type IV toxin-antitoxin system AbiEi family antitoxin domain-containing protein [Candidatus Micrarchaeaceae archaeon]